MKLPFSIAGEFQHLRVKFLDRGAVAGADQRRRAGRQLFVEVVLVGDIHGTARFVEYGKARSKAQHAGKGDALLLTDRQNFCPVQLDIQATELFGHIGKIDTFQQAQEFVISDIAFLLRVQQLVAQATQQHVGPLRQKQHIRNFGP